MRSSSSSSSSSSSYKNDTGIATNPNPIKNENKNTTPLINNQNKGKSSSHSSVPLPPAAAAAAAAPTSSNKNNKNKKSNASTSSSSSNALVQLPADYKPGFTTVICAKGNQAKSHTGNGFLRHLVDQHEQAYRRARTKQERSNIISRIYQMICMEGEFVRKLNTDGRYYKVSPRVGREKIGQTMRDRMPAEFKSARRTNKKKMNNNSSNSNTACHQNPNKRQRTTDKTTEMDDATSFLLPPLLPTSSCLSFAPDDLFLDEKIHSAAVDASSSTTSSSITMNPEDLEPLPFAQASISVATTTTTTTKSAKSPSPTKSWDYSSVVSEDSNVFLCSNDGNKNEIDLDALLDTTPLPFGG